MGENDMLYALVLDGAEVRVEQGKLGLANIPTDEIHELIADTDSLRAVFIAKGSSNPFNVRVVGILTRYMEAAVAELLSRGDA